MTDLVPTGPPGALATTDQLHEFTDYWLDNRRLSPHTRRAYGSDVKAWIDWCDSRGLPALTAKFTHINAYAGYLTDDCAKASRTVARALAAISSWYGFLVKLGAIATNPGADADRPRIDRMETTTIGFTAGEARALIAATPGDRYLGDRLATALAVFMVDIGARVSEVCRLDMADLGYDSGHRTIRLRMKGGKARQRSMPPSVCHALDAYLAERAAGAGVTVDQLAGPLFVTPAGKVVTERQVYRFVRRAARAAGLPGAAKLTPHSFRHAWATIARGAGASLETRQYSLGHADPRTTQGYDRNRFQLDQDPSYLVAAAIAAEGDPL